MIPALGSDSELQEAPRSNRGGALSFIHPSMYVMTCRPKEQDCLFRSGEIKVYLYFYHFFSCTSDFTDSYLFSGNNKHTRYIDL